MPAAAEKRGDGAVQPCGRPGIWPLAENSATTPFRLPDVPDVRASGSTAVTFQLDRNIQERLRCGRGRGGRGRGHGPSLTGVDAPDGSLICDGGRCPSSVRGSSLRPRGCARWVADLRRGPVSQDPDPSVDRLCAPAEIRLRTRDTRKGSGREMDRKPGL